MNALALPQPTAVRSTIWPDRALLGVVCLLLFFYGLDRGDLFRTESLRALVAQEMLASGNWIVPTLGGAPLVSKPPGMYAAIALCSWPAGAVSEWSARLPSALAATGCVFLFAWLFRQALGRGAGLLAGLVLPMSYPWLDKATSAEIDLLHLFWIVASLVCFFRATQDPGARGWWLTALLCVTAGFLTKWTAPIYFYLTVVAYLTWQRRLGMLFSWQHLTAATLALALASAWILAASNRIGWDAFWTTIGQESLPRFSPGHLVVPYPWHESLLHPFKILAASLPWSALACWTLRPRFYRDSDEPTRSLLLLLHCWVWPGLLFWSLPSEHATRHSFPLFPGIQGLAVLALWRLPNHVKLWRGIGIALVLWLTLKIVFVEILLPRRTGPRDVRGKAAALSALVPAGETLHFCQVNMNEGILFYYGRPLLRHPHVGDIPAGYAWVTDEARQQIEGRGETLGTVIDELHRPTWVLYFRHLRTE